MGQHCEACQDPPTGIIEIGVRVWRLCDAHGHEALHVIQALLGTRKEWVKP